MEVLESLINQYADRESAFYSAEHRRFLAMDDGKRGGSEPAGKRAKRREEEATLKTDQVYVLASRILVPALQVYLEQMKRDRTLSNSGEQESG